jgi:hypothetical protein
MTDIPLSTRERLLYAVAHATGDAPPLDSPLWSLPLTQPSTLHAALVDHLGGDRHAIVTGTLDRRLLLLGPKGGGDDGWTAADLSGQPHGTRTWPDWTADDLTITNPAEWLSTAVLTAAGRHRMLRPRTLLASLYHAENFPLPRFPLAISDLARAARTTLLGSVELMDMQLGATLDDIIARAVTGEIDVLGISATFGQHDLMIQLLDAVSELDVPPTVVAGGSLTVRNERILLDRYPHLIIGRGAGEPTIADVLAYWHDDLSIDQIRGAGYRQAARGDGTLTIGRARRTATVANRQQTDTWPELDLLDETFRQHGVAQLEASRGCTNYCSFCPRGHKGQWSGASSGQLPWLLGEIGQVFNRHPGITRTVYLVDEEFIGRGDNAPSRALAVADVLATAGFSWETSCRVDQVVRVDQDRAWHIERGHLWRGLVDRGLRRCLFGVESGVTSILERFNKETVGEQNALAIRTLTALGVPPRFTYITFDQLMTPEELHETYAFQGRTDLLLAPQPGMSVEEIVDGVRDDDWVAEHSTGRAFYTGISYMLVSMECLIGAAYTRQAGAAGLTGRTDPSMGRVEAQFADWRIGVLSRWSQLWIDRNFALDYTLKSVEKITDGQPNEVVRGLRRLVKTAAYQLLGQMISLLDGTDPETASADALDTMCGDVAAALLDDLRGELTAALATIEHRLSPDHRDLVRREYQRWIAVDDWRLINAADPCGT